MGGKWVGSKYYYFSDLQSSYGIDPQDYKILSIIIHPNYSSPIKYYDIALMKIETIIQFTNDLQPACLWSHFITSKLRSATLTGWGVVDTGK